MDHTNIIVLGNNLISNLLRKVLIKNKIDHLNFAYPAQESEKGSLQLNQHSQNGTVTILMKILVIIIQ